MINASKINDPAWDSIFDAISQRGNTFSDSVQAVTECLEPSAVSPTRFSKDDIAEVIGAWYGDASEHMLGVPPNDGIAARGVFRLKDGRYADIVWGRKYSTGSCFAAAFAARRLDAILSTYSAFDRAELGLAGNHTN